MGFKTDGMIMLGLALLPFCFYLSFDNLPVQARQSLPPFLRNKMYLLAASILMAGFGAFQIVYGI